MALNQHDIARIAHLARLELRGDEPTRLQTQLNGFFEIVAQIEAVPTAGVAPLAHPVAIVQDIALRLRPDRVTEPQGSAARMANMQSAPAAENGLFLVPKVID